MKAVLISIKPEWCELIASGKKTVEVRKSKPKIATPFKVYIYMTKTYDTLFGYGNPKKLCVDGGKVIGEFVCSNIDRIAHCGTCNNNIRLRLVDKNLYCKELDYEYLNKCKLSFSDIEKYSNGCDVYGWHISNLKIYDEPKGLWKFFKPCDGCDKIGTMRCTEEISPCRSKVLTRPPQSWCYVEEKRAEV